MPNQFTLASQFVDVDTEKGVVSAIAVNPNLYWELCDTLPPSVFSSVKIQQVFRSMVQAIEKEQPVAGVDWMPSDDPKAAAERLANLYQLRMAAAAMEKSIDQLYDSAQVKSHLRATTLINELSEKLTQAQQAIRESQLGQIQALPDLFESVLEDILQRYIAVRENGSTAIGLPTGINRLDTMLGGLQKGIHLLAAEPGTGKTTITLQIARNVSAKDYPVLFVSFEEAPDRIALKVVSQQGGLEFKRFADGYGDPNELETAMYTHRDALANIHIITGGRTTTVSQIKAKALQLMHQTGKDKCLIIVDYLQKWASVIDPSSLDDSRRGITDYRFVVAALAGDLRALSERLNSPVLVISSQNRSGQGGSSLTSLKESGDLEYGADSAMFLRKDEKRTVAPPNRAIALDVAKNRYGDLGKIDLIFRPAIGTFHEEALR